MTLTIGGDKKTYPDGSTLQDLFKSETVETPEYVTVSVNESFITKADEASFVLKDGDSVEFLYFMGGGR